MQWHTVPLGGPRWTMAKGRDMPAGDEMRGETAIGTSAATRPRLADLPRHRAFVDAGATGAAVEAMFRDDAEITGLTILRDGTAVGVLSRRLFLDLLSRQFSRELFLKRPIDTALKRIRISNLALSAETTIDQALHLALTRPGDLVYEPLLVYQERPDPDGGVGVVDMDELLRTQSAILQQAIAEKDTLLREVQAREAALQDALTELRQAQDRLVQSEKLAALGQLVAGIAHEINTPIGVALTIATYLEEESRGLQTLVSEGKLKRSALDSYLGATTEGTVRMRQNIDRAATLIRNFKRVAVDQTSEHRERFSMDQFISGLMDSILPQYKRSGHTVTWTCDDRLIIDSYPGALGQVITNLVNNAVIHAFEPGTKGTVRVTATAGRDPNRIDVTVADDGRGIPEDTLPHIFEPFFTTKRGEGGSGLGLQIVHNLVTSLLHGTLDVQSTVGKGTVFVICLPETVDQAPGLRMPAPVSSAADGAAPIQVPIRTPGGTPAAAKAAAPAPRPPEGLDAGPASEVQGAAG